MRAVLLLAFIAACSRAAEPPSLAITHVTVVDVEHGALLPDRTVILRAQRIVRVDSSRVPIPRGATIVEGTGRFIIPGLWDMHVHINDAQTAAQLLRWGITGARVMSGGLDGTLALREQFRVDPASGPRLLVVGLALHGTQSFASDTGIALVQTTDGGRRAVDSLARRGVDFIKVHEGLSREVWFAIAGAARVHHLPLTGHVPTGLTPEEVSDSGLRSIEHLEFLPDRCLVLFDSLTRAGHTPVPAGCRPPDIVRLFAHLHQNGVWLDPTISSFRTFARRQFPTILAGFGDLVPLIRNAGLPVMAGTDLGSGGMVPGESLHDELALLVVAGYSPAEALRAATLNPATFLGAADSMGKAESGYVADLVLLEGNPLSDIRNTRRIAAVIRAGVVVSR
jgi:imidazolonepropionase-like amidohydrolase